MGIAGRERVPWYPILRLRSMDLINPRNQPPKLNRAIQPSTNDQPMPLPCQAASSQSWQLMGTPLSRSGLIVEPGDKYGEFLIEKLSLMITKTSVQLYLSADVLLLCKLKPFAVCMIPLRLTLKNFLSYREATLSFRGLHTACICGSNGAGKSSLLEAIAWVIWGESRVTTEDDIIHYGTIEARVDFIFVLNQQVYRIIRSRQRAQGVGLEFQIAQAKGSLESPDLESDLQTCAFRSLTEKNVRATQQRISQHLRLDYDTFVNSAYLRQGRADEFMMRRPAERKQLLADLLKLGQYDELAERAKERSRQFKAQVEVMELNLENIRTQLQAGEAIAPEIDQAQVTIVQLQHQQQTDEEQLQTLQAQQHQRQTWQQQLTWQQQHQRSLSQDCQRLQREVEAAQHQVQALEALLHQGPAIASNYAQFQTLQQQEEALAERFQTYQQWQAQRQHYQHQQTQRLQSLQAAVQNHETQLQVLLQQQEDIGQTLGKVGEVEAALAQLHQARAELNRLDQLQAKVAPLVQRRQQLQGQVDRHSARLTARLEELHASAHQLQTQGERQPRLQQAVMEVTLQITELEQRRLYQQKVREKGLERRSFMERLQEKQRECEKQLAELDQKIALLKTESYATEGATGESPQRSVLDGLPYPPCPLCDRPLDEHHWNLVLAKHQEKHQDVLRQIWVIREQLAVSEREIQILRQEYREIDQELAQYKMVLERRGQLQEQLQVNGEFRRSLEQVNGEITQLERTLERGDYAREIQDELHLLEQTLTQLNYDERNHALARGQVDRWRWAEIKQAEIRQAQRRQTQLAEREPELCAQLADLQHQLAALEAETETGLAEFDRQLAQLGYDPDQHNALRLALRQAQPWQLRYQELHQAQHHYPQVQQRLDELTQLWQSRQRELAEMTAQVEAIVGQLAHTPDCTPTLQQLEQQIRQRREQLDAQIVHLGRLQQQQQQQAVLQEQTITLQKELQAVRHQQRIYQELVQAFGKNGIQALMIENVLPQLEAETNHILGRLSANQLHVQFVTQRAGKGKAKVAKEIRLIDTLDIVIADARGTRPYETYSGGEAFRVNFAIRLALAKLLAQRSGTALQLLIIDEGFGTQDQEGCDRLVAAINAIAPDFACILTITHMPHFKEAFQARIEVHKGEEGSQISLVV